MPGAVAQSERGAESAEAQAAAAYEQFAALHDQVDAAIVAYESIRGETYDVEYRLERLEDRVATDREAARSLQRRAEDIARASYMSGSSGSTSVALAATNLQDVVISRAMFEKASEISIASLDRLQALTRELDRLTADLVDDRARLQELETEAAAAVEQIQVVQAAALEWYERKDADAVAARAAWEQELERRRRAEAERLAREAAERATAKARTEAEAKRKAEQVAAAAAAKAAEEAAEQAVTTTTVPGSDPEPDPAPDGPNESGIFDYLVCPQAEPNWSRDTWGARRSRGRTHQGTDIFSAKGTDVYAVTPGTLRTRTGGLGGIALWLYGDDGNAYYYAHLDGWADGIKTGSRVGAGDLIAYVGKTGNASGSSPHTHFQLHPDGGQPINPYPTLITVC